MKYPSSPPRKPWVLQGSCCVPKQWGELWSQSWPNQTVLTEECRDSYASGTVATDSAAPEQGPLHPSFSTTCSRQLSICQGGSTGPKASGTDWWQLKALLTGSVPPSLSGWWKYHHRTVHCGYTKHFVMNQYATGYNFDFCEPRQVIQPLCMQCFLFWDKQCLLHGSLVGRKVLEVNRAWWMPALAVTVITVTVEFPSRGTHNVVERVKWCADGLTSVLRRLNNQAVNNVGLKVIHTLYMQSLTISSSANRGKSLSFDS